MYYYNYMILILYYRELTLLKKAFSFNVTSANAGKSWPEHFLPKWLHDTNEQFVDHLSTLSWQEMELFKLPKLVHVFR